MKNICTFFCNKYANQNVNGMRKNFILRLNILESFYIWTLFDSFMFPYSNSNSYKELMVIMAFKVAFEKQSHHIQLFVDDVESWML